MCLDNFNEIKISLHSRNHKVTVSHHEKLYSFRNEDSPFFNPSVVTLTWFACLLFVHACVISAHLHIWFGAPARKRRLVAAGKLLSTQLSLHISVKSKGQRAD